MTGSWLGSAPRCVAIRSSKGLLGGTAASTAASMKALKTVPKRARSRSDSAMAQLLVAPNRGRKTGASAGPAYLPTSRIVNAKRPGPCATHLTFPLVVAPFMGAAPLSHPQRLLAQEDVGEDRPN